MNRFIGCVMALLVSQAVFSQKDYYIYLQVDPAQAFFVKYGERVQAAGSSGFLILSRLPDSTIQFRIGFPGNKYPEQRFSLDIAAKNHGFLLSQTGSGDWVLKDIHDGGQLDPEPDPQTTGQKIVPRENLSYFAETLSKAANDPSLRYTVVREAEVKTEAEVEVKAEAEAEVKAKAEAEAEVKAKAEVKAEAEAEVKAKAEAQKPEPQSQPQLEAKPKPQEPQEPQKPQTEPQPQLETNPKPQEPQEPQELQTEPQPYSPSRITRRSESSTTEGFSLWFTDEYPDGQIDSIKILIPNPRVLAPIAAPVPAEKPVVRAPEPVVKQFSNDCKDIAGESDFVKLRRKMASANSDQKMLNEAGKAFRSQCFTTGHLRLLGALFLNEAGRYEFFDKAYESVSDLEKFPSLEAEFKDEYYKGRFRAMLRQP